MATIKKVIIRDVPKLKRDAKVEEVAKLLLDKPYGCAVIVENETPIGIVTELDLVRKIASQDNKFFKEPVSKIMSSPILTISPSTNMEEALKTIDTKRFRRYPVVDNNKLIGIVYKKDIINAVSYRYKLHRSIQIIVLLAFILFELVTFIFFAYFVK